MGILKKLLEKATGKKIEEDSIEDIKALEEQGANEADKIAKQMGIDKQKKGFVPKVNVPPVVMPKVQESSQKEKGERDD